MFYRENGNVQTPQLSSLSEIQKQLFVWHTQRIPVFQLVFFFTFIVSTLRYDYYTGGFALNVEVLNAFHLSPLSIGVVRDRQKVCCLLRSTHLICPKYDIHCSVLTILYAVYISKFDQKMYSDPL